MFLNNSEDYFKFLRNLYMYRVFKLMLEVIIIFWETFSSQNSNRHRNQNKE